MNEELTTKGTKNKAYPKYKPSGVEWLGDVPEHWGVKKLKFISSIRYGIGEPPEYVDDGVPLIRATNVNAGKIETPNLVKVDPKDIPSSRIVWLKAGDIIVVRSGAYTGDSSIIPEEYAGAIAGFDMVLSCTNSFSKFIAYCLLSEYLKDGQIYLQKLRAAQPHLNAEELGECLVILPPLPEQQAIASFLDRETGRIDSLISKKQRLLQLLAEQRTALISRAVTKGLDSSVKLKPSGVEWLGDVPEHWEIKQVRRFLLEHKQGYYTTESYIDEGFKLLRISDFDGNGFVSTMDSPSVEKKSEAIPFLLKENDFVFARTGGAGSFGLIKDLSEETIFASYLIRFRFSKKTHADFLRYSFYSKQFVHGIVRNIHGGVNQNVHAEDIKDQVVSLPPLPEQQAIAAFLDRETAKIDTLSAKVGTVIEQLKEYRTALISSAVTGKIDLREAV